MDNNSSSYRTTLSNSIATFSTAPTKIDVFNHSIISEPQHTQGPRDLSIVHGFDSNVSLPPLYNALKTHSCPYNIPDRTFNSLYSNGINAISKDANTSTLTVKLRTIFIALSTVSNLLIKPTNTHKHVTPIKHTFKSSKSIIHSTFTQNLFIFDYLELPTHFKRFFKPQCIRESYFKYSLSAYSNICGAVEEMKTFLVFAGKKGSVSN